MMKKAMSWIVSIILIVIVASLIWGQTYPIVITVEYNTGKRIVQLNADETAIITIAINGKEDVVRQTHWAKYPNDIIGVSINGSSNYEYFREGYLYDSYDQAKAKGEGRIKATSKELGWK